MACGREVSEPPRDVATQTRREFVIEPPPRDSEDIEVASDDEQREADEMILEVDEDIAGSFLVADLVETSFFHRWNY